MMLDTLITLAAIAAGAPVAVWAVSRDTTPRTWRHHTELVIGLMLLVGGVAFAMLGGGTSSG
jgi:hypothetical protein